MISPTVHRVILYVQDMSAQVRFYRELLGLPVEGAPRDNYANEYWVPFATGPCAFALHGGGTRQFGEDAPKICFRCGSVAEEQVRLRGLGIRCGEVREAAPGVQVLDVWDPEGNRLALESSG